MKRCLIILIALICSIPTARAGMKVSRTSDIVYDHRDGLALVFDVIRPEKQNGAAILNIISGGWVSRAASTQSTESYKEYTDRGFTVLSSRTSRNHVTTSERSLDNSNGQSASSATMPRNTVLIRIASVPRAPAPEVIFLFRRRSTEKTPRPKRSTAHAMDSMKKFRSTPSNSSRAKYNALPAFIHRPTS